MNFLLTTTYQKAYVEILEIINYMGQEYKKKIPRKLLNFFEKNKDLNYEYKLENLNLSNLFLNETMIILALIEQKYWTTGKEQKVLNQALKENEKKYQEDLRQKYHLDNLFKDKTLNTTQTVDNSIAMIEHKKSIFTKIKNLFKRNF